MRRRVGYSEPFTPEQFEAFRSAFVRAARYRRPRGEAEALFEEKWPEIQREALKCEQQRTINSHRKSRTSDANRTLLRVAAQGDVNWFRDNPREIDALVYGAFKAGVIRQESDIWKRGPRELSLAIKAALSEDSVLRPDTGRPPDVPKWRRKDERGKWRRELLPSPVGDFAIFLAKIYPDIRGTKSVSVSGHRQYRNSPAIEFFQTALTPFKNLSESEIVKIIERARRIRQQIASDFTV